MLAYGTYNFHFKPVLNTLTMKNMNTRQRYHSIVFFKIHLTYLTSNLSIIFFVLGDLVFPSREFINYILFSRLSLNRDFHSCLLFSCLIYLTYIELSDFFCTHYIKINVLNIAPFQHISDIISNSVIDHIPFIILIPWSIRHSAYSWIILDI